MYVQYTPHPHTSLSTYASPTILYSTCFIHILLIHILLIHILLIHTLLNRHTHGYFFFFWVLAFIRTTTVFYLFYNVLYSALFRLLWSCYSCCCGLPVQLLRCFSAAAITAEAVAASHCCCCCSGLPSCSFCCGLHKLH